MDAVDSLRFIFGHPLNRGRPVSTAARMLGWQVRSRLNDVAPVDFANGASLLVSRRMNGANYNVYCGLYEFEEMSFLMHFLRPGDVFVDVGANVGSYSVLAASVGAHAIAFEPGEHFDDLARNVAHNGYAVDCRRTAVGDGANGLVRLDDAVDYATLIKVDAGGLEAAVVAGGARVFAGASAVILAGDAGPDAEPMKTLAAMGYRPISYDPFSREIRPFERGGAHSLLARIDAEPRLRRAPPYLLRGRAI